MTSRVGRTVAFGHVGLQVTDINVSADFYRDVIGLAEVERAVRDDAYLGIVTGHPGIQLAVALLVEPVSGTLLELLEYRNVAGQAIDPSTANPGTAHVCFVVDDVDAIHGRALAAGRQAVNEPVTPTSGRWTGGRSVYLLDPDGIRVELVQRGSSAVAVGGDQGEAALDVTSEAVFLVEVSFSSDAATLRPPYRRAHLQRIAELKRQGVILEGGAFLDTLSTSIMLIRAVDAEGAALIAEDDVYIGAGVWRDVRVRPFGRVVG